MGEGERRLIVIKRYQVQVGQGRRICSIELSKHSGRFVATKVPRWG